MRVIEQTGLWKRSLGNVTGENAAEVNRLVETFKRFRDQVASLVSFAASQLPGLTIHDITHLDALWRVADQIAGEEYPLNPLEAFVFGGAVLLHDAAHVVQAYPDGIDGLRQQVIWKDIVAQRYQGNDPKSGTDEFKEVFFSVARHLHAEQAMHLLNVGWGGRQLLEDADLRDSFGELIGKIAASHHWSLPRVQEEFGRRKRVRPSPAGFPVEWKVDALKLACLLRTADAAHIDSERAPTFLMALMQPKGVSALHWNFQNKLNQPTRDEQTHLLKISSKRVFNADQRDSWWLAFDTAKMIDCELRQSRLVMKEEGCQDFAVHGVLGINSAHEFSELVEIDGWEPVDVAPKISGIAKVIETLGGASLYGDRPDKALLELLQNAFDAIRAARSLNLLNPDDGRVIVGLNKFDENSWELSVADDGIGMSRFVLTDVLLDFGRSLWESADVLYELPGLSSSKFKAVGKFGIGFFSVFMLGDRVHVSTKKFAGEGGGEQLELSFENGLRSRPVLSTSQRNNVLQGHGTIVKVILSDVTLQKMLKRLNAHGLYNPMHRLAKTDQNILYYFSRGLTQMCPTVDVDVQFEFCGKKESLINANDWRGLSEVDLCARLRIPNRTLLPLFKNGEMVGRIDISSSSRLGCILTHQGLAYGHDSLNSVLGVVCVEENSIVAARDNLDVAWSTYDLHSWAHKKLAGLNEDSGIEDVFLLKSLLPDVETLRVWTLPNGIRLNDTELLNASTNVDVVTVVLGFSFEGELQNVKVANSASQSQLIIAVPLTSWGRQFGIRSDFEEFLLELFNKGAQKWELVSEFCLLESEDVGTFQRHTLKLIRK